MLTVRATDCRWCRAMTRNRVKAEKDKTARIEARFVVIEAQARARRWAHVEER